MKPFDKNKINQAFWNGETTITEENKLKEQNDLDGSESSYFRYLETEQVVPSNLETIVWKSVKKSQKKKKQIFIQWAVAATAVLLIGTILFVNKQKQQAILDEQFAVLEQALNHVSNELTNTSTNDVIYKDEYIIIVANN